MKKLFKLLPLLLALLVFCACTANPKDFEAAGLTITLTDDFAREDSPNEGQDAVFVSDDAVVSVFCESFKTLGVDSSLSEEDYAQILKLTNDIEATVMHKGDYIYFQYEASEKDADYKYLAVVYKADDAFYMVQFGTFAELFDAQLETFWGYAESVKV